MPPGPRAAGAWLALVAVLAACADEPPTGPAAAPPPAARAAVAAPVRSEPPATPGTLVLRRTTGVARGAQAGGRAERHETWSVAEASLSRRAGVVILRGSAPAELTTARAADFVPTLVLQLPARAASAVCANASAWQRESRLGNATVVTRGRGDEPWASIEVWSAGRLLSRTRTEWERRRASWQLVAQEELSIADGATRTLAVDRAALRRAQDGAVLPRVGCPDPKAGSVPPAPVAAAVTAGAAPSWSAGLGPIGLAGLELAGAFRFAGDEMCTPTEEEAEASCTAEVIAMVGASAALVAATATGIAVCTSPAAVTIAPCVAASSGIVAAQAALLVAVDAYYKCKEKASAPKPCSCVATPSAPASVVAATGGTVASQDGPTLPLTAPFGLDCTEPAPAPTGGGGGGEIPEPTGGHWATVCTYIDHYDEWGDYMYTEFLGCKVVWIA